MVRYRALVVIALAGATLFSAGYKLGGRHPALTHQPIREMAILAQARASPAGSVLILGDSITEFAPLGELCGRRALNAGIGGATTADIARFAARSVEASRPATVVVAVGINDARRALSFDRKGLEDSWRKITEAARNRPLVIVGVNPVEAKPDGMATRDPAIIATINAFLRRLSTRANATFIEPPNSAETTDGVHLTPAATRSWIARLDAACPPLNTIP